MLQTMMQLDEGEAGVAGKVRYGIIARSYGVLGRMSGVLSGQMKVALEVASLAYDEHAIA